MGENPPDCRDICKALPLACDQRKIFLCWLWLLITLIGVEVCVYCLSKIFLYSASAAGPRSFWNDFFSYLVTVFAYGDSYPAIHLWQFTRLRHFLNALYRHQAYTTLLTLVLVAGCWAYLWWAFLGGAVHRLAAVELGGEYPITLRQALRFSREKFTAFFSAPLLPLVIILLLATINALGGMVGSTLQRHLAPLLGFAIGNLLLALLWLLFVAIAAVIVLLAVALLFTPGLMFCAVAMDGEDHYDAVSKSFIYFFHRYWHYAGYHLLALVYAIPVLSCLIGSGGAAWFIARFTVGLGLNGHVPWSNGNSDVGSIVFSGIFWIYCGLGIAFILSYYVSQKTLIYAMLRYHVEGAALTRYYAWSGPTDSATVKAIAANSASTSAPGEDGDDETPK